MATASIPVDLFNPGQVFACFGFLEAADVLLGDAEGGFDWSEEPNVRFLLRAKGGKNPIETVLEFISTADVYTVAPAGSRNATASWSVPTRVLGESAPFPFPDPPSPATLPAVLEHSGSDGGMSVRLTCDHWGDPSQVTGRDAVKFWAGAAGYPGAALARDAIALVRGKAKAAVDDPFSLSAPQSSSFRFDWRRDYIPIDIGFSLNTHAGRIAAVGFPFVELLAAVGLGNARPTRVRALEYKYGVLGVHAGDDGAAEELLDPCLLRAALGGAELPFPMRRFRMYLGWPGKEGQARAIKTVTEESFR